MQGEGMAHGEAGQWGAPGMGRLWVAGQGIGTLFSGLEEPSKMCIQGTFLKEAEKSEKAA